MPHFRVDDALHSHPKAQRAGDEAIGMWTRAGSYCMAYLTNGFVPDWWVKQQPKGTAKARKLVAVGLWQDGAERDGETGYMFHEFVGPGRQDSREKVEADRELARKRKQKSRGSSQGVSQQESQRDTPRDERGESRRKPGYIPNPTQPNPVNPLVNSGGGVAFQNAHEPPPPHCSHHMPDGTAEPCGACGAAKAARRAWDDQRRLDAIEERRAFNAEQAELRQAAIDNCGLCDSEGYIGESPVPCDHVDRSRQPAREAVMAALRSKGGESE